MQAQEEVMSLFEKYKMQLHSAEDELKQTQAIIQDLEQGL